MYLALYSQNFAYFGANFKLFSEFQITHWETQCVQVRKGNLFETQTISLCSTKLLLILYQDLKF